MPKDREKVIVAMSGGVDSSVAAALLVRAGYDVTGVFMCLGTAVSADSDSRGCCSPQDAADARRVAEQLGIPLFVLNLTEAFAHIIDYFVAEYAVGRTPNPCVHCNSAIKFGRLVQHADSIGARYVATGHYARRIDHAGGAAIARASFIDKDQSYALFGIGRGTIERMLLPIGDLADKAAVRACARELGLSVHDKPDSQEICFVADDDYVALLAQRVPAALRPGNIIDAAGKVLGRHDGFAQFTIGQRKGLKIAMGEPYYVTAINAHSGDVTIGPKAQTLGRHLSASGVNWHDSAIAAMPAGAEFDATVQIRYNHRGAPGRVKILASERFEVEFVEAVSAITPGQAVVLYDGPRLVGGGWIE